MWLPHASARKDSPYGWSQLTSPTTNYKTRLAGSKKEFIIVGDYNVTIHN
jgi:hypothetical protein